MRTSPPNPPPAAKRLIRWLCREDLQEEVLGDLDENFADKLARGTESAARIRYWLEALLFLRPHTLKGVPKLSPGPVMLKNYLNVAARFMARHKLYSTLNLVGLAVGLAAVLLIAMFVRDERSFDRYHTDVDRMYRLAGSTNDDQFDGIAKINGPWGLAVADEMPEVEAITRFVFFGTNVFEVGDTRLQASGGFYADSTMHRVFPWRFVAGLAENALVAPNSMVVTESFGRTLFDDADPVGRTVRVGGDTDYRITAVLEDIPSNSHFTFNFLASMSSYGHERHDDWVTWNQYYTYVRLIEGADAERLSPAATDIVRRHLPAERVQTMGTLAFQPVTDIYLGTNMFREIAAMGSLQTVRLLSLIAIFILALAALNFVNLATARASLRSREVGVRKSLGARRGAIMRQFLTESTLSVLIGAALAFGVSLLLLSTFNTMTGKSFVIADMFEAGLLGWAMLVVFGLGIAAGAYPAFVLSGFVPTAVMRGVARGRNAVGLRRGLVLTQFVISAALIMSTGIVADQLRYLEERPLGFEPDRLVGVFLQDQSIAGQLDRLKAELAAVTGVEAVAFSANRPGGGDWGIPIEIPGVEADDRPGVRMLVGDTDFPQLYGMQLAEGRFFDHARATDADNALLVNEEFVRQLGWTDPVGRAVNMPALGREFQIVGVLTDFHYRSARETISPLILFQAPDSWYTMAHARLQPGATAEALAGIQEVYERYDALNPFASSFVDQQFQALYSGDQRLATLLRRATLLAIFVACLGLFGLASHSAERRTREIGVRKVVGASSPRIVTLLTRETAVLVGISVLAAMPLALAFGRTWLQGFAYRTDVQLLTLALGGLAAIVVALVTAGLQAWRASRMDPVRALRIE